MSTAVTLTKPDNTAIESALILGDLSKLNTEQRLSYYKQVCESVGLNPLTRPFDYITLNGKLTLYAKRDATEQLRKIYSVSITALDIDADQPEAIMGWPGRYRTKGKAYLEFYDSRGNSFSRTTSSFEVITEQKPGQMPKVVDFTRL